MSQLDDLTRLRHIRDAITEALAFTQGLGKSDVERSRVIALALVKEIEIIGEAAARVSQECRDRYPGLVWGEMIGMRNRLVHAYFEIDLDIVWEVVTKDFPILLEQVTKIIEDEQCG